MRINKLIELFERSILPEASYKDIETIFANESTDMIPVVYSSGELLGCIYKSEFELVTEELFEIGPLVHNDFLYDYYHVLESLREFLRTEQMSLPVVDEQGFYVGICKLDVLQYHFMRNIGLTEGGSLIVISTNVRNYSLTDVAKIVENNQAKVLNLVVSSHPDSQEVEITIVLNVSEISDIIATFNRYDYLVTYSSTSSQHDEFLKERYDSLMHFLEI